MLGLLARGYNKGHSRSTGEQNHSQHCKIDVIHATVLANLEALGNTIVASPGLHSHSNTPAGKRPPHGGVAGRAGYIAPGGIYGWVCARMRVGGGGRARAPARPNVRPILTLLRVVRTRLSRRARRECLYRRSGRPAAPVRLGGCNARRQGASPARRRRRRRRRR